MPFKIWNQTEARDTIGAPFQTRREAEAACRRMNNPKSGRKDGHVYVVKAIRGRG